LGEALNLEVGDIDSKRIVVHVLPAGFHRVRLFGWLHPAARLRLNRVRALLRQPPLPSPNSGQRQFAARLSARGNALGLPHHCQSERRFPA